MNTQSFYTRHMLQQYGRQLVSARRLARYQKLLGHAEQEDGPSDELKRRLMVERIAREVVDNLIFAGSENPVVTEVRQRLDNSMGEQFEFQYPPGELDFNIFKNTPNGAKAVGTDEKRLIMGKLWDIAIETVNDTML